MYKSINLYSYFKKTLPFILIPLQMNFFDNKNNQKKLLCNHNKDIKLINSLDSLEHKLDKLIESQSKNKTFMSNFPHITHDTYLKELITPELYSKYFHTKTKEGFTLDDIIQAGIDNQSTQPDSKDCLVSPSKDSYTKFNILYQNYLKLIFPQEDFTKKFENESYSMTKSLLMGMQELIENYFLEVDFTSNRNLENFNFVSKINRSDRQIVKERIKSAIVNLEDEVFKSKGTFTPLNNNTDFFLIDKFLFSAGVYRDWPYDRLIYFNGTDQRFICVVNEEDHLKIKLNSEDKKQMTELMLRYFEFLEKMETSVNFAVDNKFGFLNTRPANSGTGTYFNVRVKVTSDPIRQKEMIAKVEESKKDITLKIDQKEGQYELNISNSNPFFTFSTLLIELLNIKDYFK